MKSTNGLTVAIDYVACKVCVCVYAKKPLWLGVDMEQLKLH